MKKILLLAITEIRYKSPQREYRFYLNFPDTIFSFLNNFYLYPDSFVIEVRRTKNNKTNALIFLWGRGTFSLNGKHDFERN